MHTSCTELGKKFFLMFEVLEFYVVLEVIHFNHCLAAFCIAGSAHVEQFQIFRLDSNSTLLRNIRSAGQFFSLNWVIIQALKANFHCG